MSAEHSSNDFVGGDGYSQVGASAEGGQDSCPRLPQRQTALWAPMKLFFGDLECGTRTSIISIPCELIKTLNA